MPFTKRVGTMKRLIGVFLATALVTSTLQSQDFNKGGRTAFQFLKIGIGARQVALGEACIASVRDVNSVFWNPAGISGIGSAEASFSYADWFADLAYFSGAAGFRWRDIGTFAVSYASLGYGEIPEALVTISGGGSDTRTGKSFTGSDLLIGLSYARDFTLQLSIGFTVKYLKEKLFVYGVDLFAFDVGTYYDTQFKGIRFAMAAQNFAGSVKWLERSDREEGYDIPLVYRVGASIGLLGATDAFVDAGGEHRFEMNVDAIHTNDYAERLHVGGEYRFSDLLALRGGYRFNYEEGNWSFGFGLNYEFSGMEVQTDYAYVSYEFLDTPHRLTVSLGF